MIDLRKLHYTHTDYPTLAVLEHTSRLTLLDGVDYTTLWRALAVWFTVTAALALYKAKIGKYAEHKAYVVRHIGSGIWVALQRLYVCTSTEQDLKLQKADFGDGGIIGIVVAVLLAELAVLKLTGEGGGKQKMKYFKKKKKKSR